MGVVNLKRNGNLVGSSFDELFIGSGLVFYTPLNNDVLDYTSFNNTNTFTHGSIIYAHYLFSNGSTDSSSYARDLTGSAVVFGPGKIGSAAYFNGTASYLQRASGVGLSNRSPQTISAWIKVDSLAAQRSISSYDGYGTFSIKTTGVLEIELQGSSGANGGGRISSTGSITTGSWFHVTCTINNAIPSNQAVDIRNADLYINGSLSGKSLSAIANNSTTSTNLIVGGYGSATALFSGSIDDVRIYATTLNSFEIGSIYNNGTGLETEIEDIDYTPGYFGSGLRFYHNSVIPIGNPSHLQFGSSNSFTFSLWCNPSSSGNQTAGGLFNRSFIAGLDTGGVSGSALTFRMGVRLGATVALSTSTTYSTGSWYHVVGTSNSVAKQVQVWVNGSSAPATSFSTLNWVNGGTLQLGGGQVLSGNSTSFNGLIDDVRVYNRLLGSEEINEMYENKPFFTSVSGIYSREFRELQSLSGSVKMRMSKNNSIYISGELVEN